MDLVRAIVLGVVQGLSEFLPISSSGHLILVRDAFGWPDDGLAFDVGLHLGTLLALLVYFWRDWAGMAQSGARNLGKHRLKLLSYAGEARLLLLLAVGTVPAGIGTPPLLSLPRRLWWRGRGCLCIRDRMKWLDRIPKLKQNRQRLQRTPNLPGKTVKLRQGFIL